MHMNRRSGESEEKRRKPNTACSNCRRSHFRCVGGPPCDKCVKRGLRCEQPKKREERIQILEDTVKNISVQLERERLIVHEKELSFRLTTSWRKLWEELVTVEKYPLRVQSNSKASQCFRALLSFAKECVFNPSSEDILIPKMEELEELVLGEHSQGVPFYVMKNIIVYSCLCSIFLEGGSHSLIANTYATKLNTIFFTYPKQVMKMDKNIVVEARRISRLSFSTITTTTTETTTETPSISKRKRTNEKLQQPKPFFTTNTNTNTNTTNIILHKTNGLPSLPPIRTKPPSSREEMISPILKLPTIGR